jgi:hypothetical protein
MEASSIVAQGGLNGFRGRSYLSDVMKFLVWCVLFVLCWPLALLALVLYPIVWLLLIPFRIVGIAVDGVLGLIRGIFMFPARLLGSRP